MKKIKKIYVEITNICNLTCSFCPKTSRAPTFMSISDFEKIAREVKKHSDFIYLHIKGEPLFHPKISEFFRICEELSLKICLTTNGTLIKQHKQLLLDSNALHKVHISLHSFEANQLNISLNQYMSNIVDLIKNKNFITVLRLWNDGGMDNLNDEILQMLGISLCNISDFSTHTKINQKSFLEFGEKFDWPDLSSTNKSFVGTCYGLRDQIGILVDGTVVCCCLDNNGDTNLGNIFENSLQEIFENDSSQEILRGFLERKLIHSLCQTCGFINRFNKKTKVNTFVFLSYFG